MLALGGRLNEEREKEQARRQDSEPEWLEEGCCLEITVGKPVWGKMEHPLSDSQIFFCGVAFAVVRPSLRGRA